MNWSSRPFVRILIFFIIGILISKYIPVVNSIVSVVYIITIVLLTIIAAVITVKRLKHKYLTTLGFLLGLILIILGIVIYNQKTLNTDNLTADTSPQNYIANVISNPTKSVQSVKAILLVTPIDSTIEYNKTPIKVSCYFPKNNKSKGLKYGDVIVFKGKLTLPSNPKNPYEFNYKNYLNQNGIGYSSYINTWKLIDYQPHNLLIAFASKTRNKLLNLLQQNGLSGSNYAVAAAVLLGYDDFMESDLKQDYIMAGAMHILCVSGLHVGIIYLVISFLLSFLQPGKFNKILKATLLLLFVWMYATITGLSPSVQRASLMLSVFIIGNALNRNRDAYNTLAVSALILLLINPQLLFNVGFQLSYAAVLGILTFHQPIYNLLYFSNSLFDKIWSITALSIAAQLATFPIATHYFHFFPPWFWLTNLFTFPLSFIIIITGLAFVLTSWLPVLPHLLGLSLSGMIYLLNTVVGIVKYLPFSGIDFIYTSLPMLFLLYTLIILIFVMVKLKKPQFLIPVLINLIFILGLNTFHRYNILKQKRIVIYSINQHSAYDFISGNQHILLTDTTITSKNLNYKLKNSKVVWGISDENTIHINQDTVINNSFIIHDNFIIFDNIKMLNINQFSNYYNTNNKLSLDLIIVSGKKKVKLDQLVNAFDFNNLIIDSSVPPWNYKKITEFCTKNNITCYNTRDDGAIIIDPK